MIQIPNDVMDWIATNTLGTLELEASKVSAVTMFGDHVEVAGTSKVKNIPVELLGELFTMNLLLLCVDTSDILAMRLTPFSIDVVYVHKVISFRKGAEHLICE